MEENFEQNTPKKKKHEVVRENPWIISTFVLGIFVLIMLVGSFGGITGKVVSSSTAANAILDFANENGANAELVGVEEEGEFYKVMILIQGQEIPVYVTRDGKYFTSSLIPLNQEEIIETETSKPVFTEEQNSLIQEFSSCLYDSGMRIYYAGWCSHCHDLIEAFGGLENMGEIMIECQTSSGEEGTGAELCSGEEITSFPTIKINGEKYSGARTFDAFAESTGCTLPQF